MPPTTLPLLPNDLLVTIADYLPPNAQLSLLLTCRNLHHQLLPVYHALSAKYPASLLHAASGGLLPLTGALLASGADPDALDPHGLSPLDHAARAGHNDIINQLLSSSATLSLRKGGRQPYPLFSPLDHAAKHGHTSTVALLHASLLSRFSPAKVSDALGRALLHAVSERRKNVVQWILDHAPPPPARLQEALHKAATLNAIPLVTLLLLAKSVDINAYPPGQPLTLLHRAAERGRLQLVLLLLSHGAEVDARDGLGLTPLHYSVRGCAGEVAQALVDAGAGINVPSGFGTPFDAAVRRGWGVGVEVMARAGLVEGWDVGEVWEAVKKRRMRLVEDAFLRAVAEVLGEDVLEVLLGPDERYAPGPRLVAVGGVIYADG